MNKLVSAAAVAMASNSTPELPAIPVLQIEQFVAGLIDGLVNKQDLPELQVCMKDAENLSDDIVTLIADLKQKDLSGIVSALQVVIDILNKMDQDLSDCKATLPEIDEIKNFLAQFKNPFVLVKTVSKNLFAHFPEIIKDIDTATQDF